MLFSGSAVTHRRYPLPPEEVPPADTAHTADAHDSTGAVDPAEAPATPETADPAAAADPPAARPSPGTPHFDPPPPWAKGTGPSPAGEREGRNALPDPAPPTR
ncbi:hypothetical protein SCA03_47750 [Streptomyces cacaoi]|uniref:Uncharacterized protein n=1 Tax=Streptomyces cacaoi TaxID=1898 RepID=A0A4Y3R3W0_STRCI|nr:hypothetical protein SCA03_47750 [Streptomyces cacaoi]